MPFGCDKTLDMATSFRYIFVFALASLVTLFHGADSHCYTLPTYEEIRSSYRSSEAYILDRNGNTLQVIRNDLTVRRLQWTELKDISPALIRAVLTSEDKRFFSHRGVDWIAAGKAFWDNLRGSTKRGASTITMQLVGLIDQTLRQNAGKRTLTQKIEQARAAMEIERHWTKEQILEAYLNLVYFRGEIQGIGSASKFLLDKSPLSLNDLDSAILAALIRQPQASPQRVIIRASNLLTQVGIKYNNKELRVLAEGALSRVSRHSQRHSYIPTFVLPLLDVTAGVSVRTTIDRDLQHYAMEILRRNITHLRASNVHDGAVLVVHNPTGHILAYVANAGDISTAPFVDGIRAKRQAGSTLKPFLYGLALEKGLLDASSIIDDAPVSVYTERGLYTPQNYNDDYKGAVTLRQALASSLNAPAVKTLILVGIEDFHSRLLKLGLQLPEKADHYGYSIALGAVDVSLYELVSAYRALSQMGLLSNITLKDGKRGSKAKRVFSREVAFIISDILSDRGARALTFGLETPIATNFWTAVKTGTSKDMRDNWCIGYSDTYTVGVWVGNFSGRPMWNVSGITGAAHIWHEVMRYLHRDKKSHPPRPPDGVIAKKVIREGVEGQDFMEWFIKRDTATDDEAMFSLVTTLARIVYPPEGTTIALDPDMPADRQILYFRVEGYRDGMSIHIGDSSINLTEGYALWRPVRGAFKAILKGTDGEDLDKVNIQVKGFIESGP